MVCLADQSILLQVLFVRCWVDACPVVHEDFPYYYVRSSFLICFKHVQFHYIHKFIGYVQLPDSCNILLTEKWIVSVVERNRLSQAMSSEYVVESTDNNFLPFNVRVNQPTTDGTLTVCMV